MKKLFLTLLFGSTMLCASAVEGFKTSGTKLLDPTGTEFVMRGVNYSWAWQRDHENSVIPAAKRIGCNAIRIQLSTGGSGWAKCQKYELENLIRLCRDNKLIAIFNTHDQTGSDDVNSLKTAANYWIEMKDVLNANRDIVLVNISNEWHGTWNASDWANGYKTVIPMMRDAGILNTLIVDADGYGQNVRSVPDYGSSVLDSDSKRNIVFSLHLYEHAAGNDNSARNAIVNAFNAGAPVIVGEFTYRHRGSDVAYQTIMDVCQERKAGYLGWSWTGNSSDVAECDMFATYDDSQYKTNGTKIVKGSNGIKETSVECAYYSGNTNPDSGKDDPNNDNQGDATTYDVTNGDLNDWKTVVEIPESVFAKAEIGSKVTISGNVDSSASVDAPAQVQLAYKTPAEWTWTQFVDYDDVIGGKYTFTIDDADLLAGLKAHGLYIKGQKFTVTKVTVDTVGSGSTGGGSGNTVWTGNADLGNWVDIIEIPESAFVTAVKGSKVILKFTNVSGNAETPGQVQLAYKTPAEWTWTQFVDYADIIGNEYSFTVNDSNVGNSNYTDLEMLKAHGLYVKGQNATLTEVVLQNPGFSSDITVLPEPEVIDAPAEWYTLQGIRVDNPEPGRIYILRQGNKVHKVVM